MPGPAPTGSGHSADVLVIGAGLAGLCVAGRLAERGANVVVAEAAADRADPPGVGLVEMGPPGLFSRCVAALGARAASALHEFSRRNAELIAGHQAAVAARHLREGSFSLTNEASEMMELRESARLLREHVPDAAVCEVLSDAGAVASRTSTAGFTGGIFRPDDAMLDARAFLEAAEDQALGRGVRFLRGVSVSSLETGAAGRVRAILNRDAFDAEMIVICAGAASVRLHGWLRDRMVPVLGQGLSMAGVEAPRVAEGLVPITANFGHVAARTVSEGSTAKLLAWNIPWSLRGSDPDGVRDEVLPDQQARIESWIAGRFPAMSGTAGRGVERRWACHVGWTRDSLPIAGPAPGRPRLIYCTGFSGHEWGLAAFVARVVADGMLGERPPEGFEIFSPRRFLEE